MGRTRLNRAHDIMQDMSKMQARCIGRCIYCGATDDLRQEHIVPFGLSGPTVLKDASCGNCAKKTGRMEETVLRGPMWPVRVFRDLRSRRKHKDAPDTHPLSITRNGRDEIIELPLEEYPILL